MRHKSTALHALALLLPWAAHAADVPFPTASPPVETALPLFTWSGFYAGINAGYIFDDTARVTLTGVTPANREALDTYETALRPSISDDGFTGGGQIGFNYQFLTLANGGLVAGVETDAAYTDISKGGNFPTEGADRLFTTNLDFLGTVRGRLGFAYDQFLFYGTGGLAYGEVDNRVALLDRATNSIVRFGGETDAIRTGYAYGAGLEYALPANAFAGGFGASAVTVKAEYLHYDLGTSSVLASPNSATNAIGAYNAQVRTSGNLARVGLNYGF